MNIIWSGRWSASSSGPSSFWPLDGGMTKVQAVVICAVLGLTTAVGAIGGAALLGEVDSAVMSAILGVGAAALLYLVVEAHEVKESMLLSVNFFLGFILIYILASIE